jgi:hypothetical protein
MGKSPVGKSQNMAHEIEALSAFKCSQDVSALRIGRCESRSQVESSFATRPLR